jgi:hypothetical protein
MTKPKRRWFQFSLRRLFVLIAMVAAGMGWIASEKFYLRHEARITKELLNSGAPVIPESELYGEGWWDKFRWQLLGPRASVVAIRYGPITDLLSVVELKYLREVSIQESKIEDLTPLLKLKHLKAIGVREEQISDEQLNQFRNKFPQCEVRQSGDWSFHNR